MIPRIPLATAAAVAAVLILSACSSPEPVATNTPKPTASAPATTPEPEEPAAEETPGAAPTCETIISAGTVTTLTDIGWTFEQQDFRVGENILDDGLFCVWGDYTVASDHVQIYGWAPLEDVASAEMQEYLLSQGWLRAEGDAAGMYITEDPSFALGTDDEGFGMTYLFGDGWVKVADTKQSLVLVEWP